MRVVDCARAAYFVAMMAIGCGSSEPNAVGETEGVTPGAGGMSGEAETGGAASSTAGTPITSSGGTNAGSGGAAINSGGSQAGSGGSIASGGNGGRAGGGGAGGAGNASGGSNSCGGASMTGAGSNGGGSAGSTGDPAATPGTWVNITPPGLYNPTPHNPPFGITEIALDASDPSTLFVSTDQEGIWKSTTGGSSWVKLKSNIDDQASGSIHVDPKNHDHMYYCSGVRGSALGFWVSNDGAKSWAQPAAFLAGVKSGPWNNDVGHCATDTSDFNHVLLTFHSPWSPTSDAGVVESKDGGTTWIVHGPKPGWGASASIDFLYSAEHCLGSSNTWLLGAPYSGMWRTIDAGNTWTKTNAPDTGHGGTHLYYAKTGVLYGGATHQMIRSTDNGINWVSIGPKFNDEYYCVIGDGNNLYAQESNTGYNSIGPQPWVTSPESDGITWTKYNDQTFLNGPFRMAFDKVNRIVYSVNWNGGVWALKVP